MHYTFSNFHRKLIIIVPAFLVSIVLQSQKIHTKEIKETFSNGVWIYSILTDDIKMKFNEDLEYNWYNESTTGSQSSKGATGGKLLHGKFSSFNEQGRLTFQCFYKYGLQDSLAINWDDNGEISRKEIFKNGIEKYCWTKYEKYIFETYGSSNKPFKRSIYTLDNKLISEEKDISTNPLIREVKSYYESNNKLQIHYYVYQSNNGIFNYGRFEEYFENGSLKRSGNYDTKYKLANKVGLWLVFNENSNKLDSIIYKLSETNLGSADEKEIGSLVYVAESKDWIKCGYWNILDKTGKVIGDTNMDKDPSRNPNQIIDTEIFTEPLTNTIKLVKTESGLFEIPVVLNGVLKINFIFDSGASEVSLSPDVALTLIRTGTVTDNDFLPDQTYTFADGSSAKSKRFLIKKLIIGNQSLTNIEASISNSLEAPMLIGQNVLNKLGSITIDYDNLLLIIKSK